MSELILHILVPSRYEDIGALVGDLAALYALRDAVDDAIHSGSGGALLTQSDGEIYALAVVREEDMTHVCTNYANEIRPVRAEREVVPLRAVHHMMDAIRKAVQSQCVHSDAETHTPG
ncbi:hypothetical protein [Rugamonas rivuli]|uniref:Uncharacterized protein n=1 Tax=Rugamonas rivuli TaxID=2743358 RepID=A0A843SB22_9BURK|nr:hypothetical protein [Rugamonas rivuli]MQA21685.1 hypothetical protein [Rugamonas rivuli]